MSAQICPVHQSVTTLGEMINQENIDAKLNDGVLRLTLPKVEKATPKKTTAKKAEAKKESTVVKKEETKKEEPKKADKKDDK